MFNFRARLLILGFIVGSSLGHAGPCELALSIVTGPLTPSTWLVKGDDLAKRVVAAPLPRNTSDATSPWLEFQRDARYHGPLTTELDALVAINGPRTPPPLRGSFYGGGVVALPMYFVTWSDLGVRAINRMVSRRIYPVGLTLKSMAVDGVVFDPEEFRDHDLAHCVLSEAMQTCGLAITPRPEDDVTREFYRVFRYDGLVEHLSTREHLLFDLAYFLNFHEGLINFAWGQRFGDRARALGADRLSEMYPGPMDPVTFSFTGTDLVGVRLIESEAQALARRFLDRGDLWVNLPVELKAFCRAYPERAVPAIIYLIDEALTLFYRAHYATARRVVREFDGGRD